MKISGCTFIRNGSILGYPYIDSINSLLQLCDEVIVVVGNSEDDTLYHIKQINNPKLRIIETTWNDVMADRGYTYAQQKMIAQFNCSGDWVFYLECDEIIHEKNIPLIRAQMAKYLADSEVEGFTFDYYHFYGTANHIAISPKWYKKAVRIIRNTIRSWAPDGLFWIIMDTNKRGRYPRVINIGCHIYHYGHIRSSVMMNEKSKRVERYWGKKPLHFTGYGNIDHKSVIAFVGNHPSIIGNWLKSDQTEKNLIFNPNYILTKRDIKYRIMMVISKLLGNIDLTKKHYKLLDK